MKKKVLVAVLLITMIASLLTGCGKSSKSDSSSSEGTTDNTNETSTTVTEATKEKPYEVNFIYLVSTSFADQEEINKAFSDLALKEINIKVNLIPLTYGECLTQTPLMLSGGEALDVFPYWATYVAPFIDSGYIEDLSKYTDKMPNIMKWVGADDLSCTNMGGITWGVTNLRERANPEAILMRQDILDELGINAADIKTLDDVTNVYAAVHEAHPDMVVLGGAPYESLGDQGDMAQTCDPLTDELGVLENYGQELKVVNEFETAAWLNEIKVTRAWYEAGYVSKDQATSADTGETLLMGGNLFSYISNYKPNTTVEKLSTTGYQLAAVLTSDPLCSTTSTGGYGYCISSNSENPEKAVEFLDWLFGSAEANDLLNFGIQGKHWVEDSNGNAAYPEGVTAENCGYHLDWGWALPNQFVGHLWVGNDVDLYDQYVKFRESAHVSKAYGFSYDSSSLTNEIIACKAVISEYMASITTGAVDPDEYVKKMNDDLYNAGLQKIIDEKQKQLDEWAAKNAK